MSKTLALAASLATACVLALSGCGDDEAAPALPAIDVSSMTKVECEAVRRMSVKQGASQAEVDRRVNCAGARS
jgi:hypothetical protein